MVEGIIIFLYIVFFISMLCSIRLTVKLYVSGKNYLIAILAAGMALCELVVLSSIIWIRDFENDVPKGFCIFQGIVLQYSIYLQIVAALCFSLNIYQLLVCCKQGTGHQQFYFGCVIIIPVVMTTVVAAVSIPSDAIQPFALNCDVKEPVWVRLIGYSGFNFVLTFIGVYFSAQAAYEVFKHLDQFKAQIPSREQANTDYDDINDEIKVTVIENQDGDMQNRIKSYNMTKTAAIRMVLFACGFALINFVASIQTILYVISGDNFSSKSLSGNDFAGAFMGIIIYLVFGLPRNVKKFFCSTKRKQSVGV